MSVWASIKRNWRYPVLHWMLSLILAPLLIGILGMVQKGEVTAVDMGHASMLLLVFLTAGVVLSTPVLLVHIVLFATLLARGTRSFDVLVACNAVVILLMALTMMTIGGEAMRLYFTGYALAVLLTNLLLRSFLPVVPTDG